MENECISQQQRDPCMECCLKHLGQARAILKEVCKGYKSHRWFAVGHLGEAEDEIVELFPDLARLIRDERIKLMEEEGYVVKFSELFIAVLRRYVAHGEEVLKELGYDTSEIQEHKCSSS